MILRSGFCVLSYGSFTEDVLGQISRSRLVLGIHTDLVVDLLPTIQSALDDNGFLYRHSGLGPAHARQMSVMIRKGIVYRMAVIPAGEDGDPPPHPVLHIDTCWIEKEAPAALDEYRDQIAIQPGVLPQDIDEFMRKVPR
jgi:hypothetical protein